LDSYGWFIYAVAYFVLSIGAGIAASKMIEIPALALRERYFRPSVAGIPPRTLEVGVEG